MVAPECWVPLSVLRQDPLKEGAIGDKVKSTGTGARPENGRKAACSAFTSSCAYAENNLVLFFPPCSFSLLVFQLYPLAFICLLIFDEYYSSSKASLAPSFHVHSSHFPSHLERASWASSSSTLQLTLLPSFLLHLFLPFMGSLY